MNKTIPMDVFRPITLIQGNWQESHPPEQPLRDLEWAGQPEEPAKMPIPLLNKKGE